MCSKPEQRSASSITNSLSDTSRPSTRHRTNSLISSQVANRSALHAIDPGLPTLWDLLSAVPRCCRRRCEGWKWRYGIQRDKAVGRRRTASIGMSVKTPEDVGSGTSKTMSVLKLEGRVLRRCRDRTRWEKC